MPAGFFQTSVLTAPKQAASLIPKCGSCGLFRKCQSPKMPVSGEGKRKILIVGEGPGKNEDREGLQFVGDSGRHLEKTLTKIGVDFRRDCWVTNAIICRASHDDGSNRNPTDREIGYCQPNLIKTINELKPEVVVPLGGPAVKSLIGWLWREEVGSISRWDGWRIPCQKINAWVCPTWHPAYILRSDYGSQKGNEVRGMLFEQHLRAACELEGRPWKTLPDYRSRLLVVVDPAEAARRVRAMAESGLVAIDFETTRLKPDHPDAAIFSCAVSDGKASVSYPWHGEAIEATGELLRSGCGLIASNMKFEQRWLIKEFGTPGDNWKWDTMLAAHVLDNRGEISSLKFQAFCLLGVDAWDVGIKPFFRAKSANEGNRIREAPLHKLLEYNAMDSLMEYKVARIQAKRLGVELG